MSDLFIWVGPCPRPLGTPPEAPADLAQGTSDASRTQGSVPETHGTCPEEPWVQYNGYIYIKRREREGENEREREREREIAYIL